MTPQVTKLIEECSEVIHALCKVERFGKDGYRDVHGPSNMENVLSEINDLRNAVVAYLETV